MTVTESGEGKRVSSPDPSYVPLEGTTADGEGRASSEESRSGNNNNLSTAGDRDDPVLPRHSVPRSNRTPDADGSAGQELAPLNKRDVATEDPEDPEDPNVGGSPKPTVPTAGSEPPDGGARAWSIMVASFLINGILFGVINTYSIVYTELRKKLEESGDSGASSKASLVGSLTIGTAFLLSPVASILTDIIGIRITTFAGGALASFGTLLSSIFYDKVEVLYLTYGVMYGVGASLAYTPSLVILGHYFKRYIGLVNGVVTAGSSVFTILISPVMSVLIEHIGLQGWFRCLVALTAIVMPCALLFKPILPPPSSTTELPRRRSNVRVKLKEAFNVSIWKQRRYVVWAGSIPIALFGYFVPYVHIGKFVKVRFADADETLPVMCIGLTSGLGRLLFGYIADKPRVSRIFLQQISFVSIGVLTMLLPVTNSFVVLLIISLGMGLFDGCFISLLGPIAFDICGRKGATQAIGFLLGMSSVPLTVGPPIAGLLFDYTASYNVAFYVAGIPPIVGALAMFMLRFVKDEETGYGGDETEPSDRSRQPLAQSAWQNGNGIKLELSRARKEPWKDDGRVGERAGAGTRRTPSPSCRYDHPDFFRHNCQRPKKIHNAAACGSPGCHLAYRDIPRCSESEPLLCGSKFQSRDNGDAGWPRSFRGADVRHPQPQPRPRIRFSERRICDDQGRGGA